MVVLLVVYGLRRVHTPTKAGEFQALANFYLVFPCGELFECSSPQCMSPCFIPTWSLTLLFFALVFVPDASADAALARAWRGREPFRLAQVLRADLDASELYMSSMYALYKRGDPIFETLMHSGSLLSLWHRLHAICKRHTSLGQETIKWSVVRQAPRLNRLAACLVLPTENAAFSELIAFPPRKTPSHSLGLSG